MKKNLFLRVILSGLLLIFSGCYFNNTPFVPSPSGFHLAPDSPFIASGDTISGMAGNGERIVAVSREGMIAFSNDSGINWEALSPDNIKGNFSGGIHFNDITWAAGYFLAAGDGGKAAYSSDGLNWQAGVIGPMSPMNILCVASGSIAGRTVFAAAGINGRLAHAIDSPAGPWYMADQSPFGTAENFGHSVHALAYGIIKGNGVFVAAGDGGRIAILKDLSGKWYGGRAGTNETFRGLAFGNDRFIAVGDNGLIKYSFNPRDYTWTTIKDDTLGLRTIQGISFDPLIKHFILFTEDTVVGVSEFGDTWNAANFRIWFIDADDNSSEEKISTVNCSAARILMGGSRGTILFSN